MRHSVRKITCLLLLVACLTALTPGALAADLDTAETQGTNTLDYSDISVVIADISLSTWGKATCKGSVLIYDPDRYIVLTVTLQRLENNKWVNVNSWSTNCTDSPILELTAEYYVVSGYSYRTMAMAAIYESNKTTFIETGAAYSNSVP